MIRLADISVNTKNPARDSSRRGVFCIHLGFFGAVRVNPIFLSGAV